MNAQSLALILSLALNTSASVSTPANLFNQYTKVGVATYASDANGNLTSDGTRTYTYDFANRLLTATGPGLSATSTYDGLGRRVTKTVNGVLTRYLYDGASILEERSATNTLQASYVWGPLLDELLTMTRGGTTSYILADALGSTVALTDASGTLLESVTYDAYGLPLSLSHLGNPYFFTGREYDTETGLYHLRARSYDPRIGRFLQRDPLGDQPDINLYRYVGNNPINRIDLLGLSGYLIIHSGSDSDREGSLSGHSWIEYRNDNGTVTTYGTYGNNAGAQRAHGLNKNSELGLVGTATRQTYINDSQEAVLTSYIDSVAARGEGGWSPLCPCADFASDAWTRVTGESLQDRNWFGVSNPNTLADSIRRLNDGQAHGILQRNRK